MTGVDYFNELRMVGNYRTMDELVLLVELLFVNTNCQSTWIPVGILIEFQVLALKVCFLFVWFAIGEMSRTGLPAVVIDNGTG
jgi:hypothetical protein